MPISLPTRLNIAEHFLARPAREHPSRIAVQGEPRPYTYRELAAMAERAAGALLDAGCRRGDRVLVVLPDSAEFIAGFFGIVRIGAIAVPVNSGAPVSDYAHFLADCAPRFAIVAASRLEALLESGKASGIERLIVVGGPAPKGKSPRATRWEECLAAAPAVTEAADTAASEPAFFLYTSGSGGTPKAAVHRHQDMMVTFECYARGVLGLHAEDRTLSVSKLFFAYGMGNGMYFPLGVGASTILYPARPRPEAIAEMVSRYRPTAFFAVPTFYGALLGQMERGLRVDFSSVRLAVSAGEPLPAELFTRCRERLGIEILDGIGSTEMLHMFLSPRPGAARPGSCGIEVPHYEACVVDEEGQPVERGEIGNLLVRGESAFAGYWNKPELTERTKRGDWVVTGDKFFQDEDGYFHHCGRSDDMMKVSGMWVSPGEVENALLAHEGIAEAAVVGRSFDGLMKPVAYVVARTERVNEVEFAGGLREFLRGRLAGHKIPVEFHLVRELPKTATGKIQRYKLR